MYPDLSYILHALIGTQPDNPASIVKTFGLLLVCAILTGSFILYLELKRKASEGLLHANIHEITVGKPATPFELISNGLIGFFIGFKALYAFMHFAEFQADAGAVLLSTKGAWLGGIIGAILGAGMKYWETQKERLPVPQLKKVKIYPHDRIGDITIVAAISGIVGAKIFALVEDLPTFFADPIGTFFSGSGMAIYGGLIGGFVVGYFYLKAIKINPIHVLDAAAPALIVAYGVGRLGCHLSGDGDWGIVNTAPTPSWWFLPDSFWAFDYPYNVLNQGVAIENCQFLYCNRLAETVYPTPIYEIAMALIIGAILWALRKHIKIAGAMFCTYLMFNGLERFIIEKIRVNDKYEILGMQSTQAEFIAVMLFLFGAIGWLILWKRNNNSSKYINAN